MIVTKDERKFLVDTLFQNIVMERKYREEAKQTKEKAARMAAMKAKASLDIMKYVVTKMCSEKAVTEAEERAQTAAGI